VNTAHAVDSDPPPLPPDTPDFLYVGDSVTDPGPGGNNNGQVDSGETFLLEVELRNTTDTAAQDVDFLLISSDPAVLEITEVGHPTTWPAMTTDTVIFEVRLGSVTTARIIAFSFSLTASSGGPWAESLGVHVSTPCPEFEVGSNNTIDPAPGGNANRRAEGAERVTERMRVKNSGDITGQNVFVTLTTSDPDIKVVKGRRGVGTWLPGQRRAFDFILDIAADATEHIADATITLTMEGCRDTVFDIEIRIFPGLSCPVFARRSNWTHDPPEGGDGDGKAEGGERIAAKIRVKNDSAIPGQKVFATFTTGDSDITIVKGRRGVKAWLPGQVRVFDFILDIAADATEHVADAIVTITMEGCPPVTLPMPVPIYPGTCPVFAQRSNWIHDPLSGGDGDDKAESGEQVASKIRVKSDSAIPGQKVFATFTTDDPDITIVKGRRGVGTWVPGTVRVFDFILDIAPDATEHVAHATVTLTMAGCRSTAFPIRIPINPVVRFVQRNAFARDKVTGDNDGKAEPGEQIEMRVRLKNEGQLVGKNVVVTLSTSDANVTIPSPTVTHATWHAGVARNNLGLVVDLGAGVGSSVAFVVDVTADDGGPWQFTFDLPVAAAAAPSALVLGIPAVSVLLPNYPNPFNPETWIPFGLAEGADVTVTIYNMVGAPVRRIDLGYLEPGVYESRREAAYWDGRNALGERVASGVYIYELRAGDFREIRRMLVRK
jgi:hypothetical protein